MYTFAWINLQTNKCDNVTVSSKHISECNQVDGYLILDLEAIGGGGIGDVWDGNKLITPQIEAAADQPITSGVQDI